MRPNASFVSCRVVTRRRLRGELGELRADAFLPPQHAGATRREAVFPARLPARRRAQTQKHVPVPERLAQRSAQRTSVVPANTSFSFVVIIHRRSRSRLDHVADCRHDDASERARAAPERPAVFVREIARASRSRIALRRRRHLRVRPRERARPETRPPAVRGEREVRPRGVSGRLERERFVVFHHSQQTLQRVPGAGHRRRRRRRRDGGDHRRDAAGHGGSPPGARRAGARGVLAQARLARDAHDAHDAREAQARDQPARGVRPAHRRVLGGAADQLPAPGKRPGAARQARAARTRAALARVVEQAHRAHAERARDGVRGRARLLGIVADHQRGRGWAGRSGRDDAFARGRRGGWPRRDASTRAPRRAARARRDRCRRGSRRRSRRRRHRDGIRNATRRCDVIGASAVAKSTSESRGRLARRLRLSTADERDGSESTRAAEGHVETRGESAFGIARSDATPRAARVPRPPPCPRHASRRRSRSRPSSCDGQVRAPILSSFPAPHAVSFVPSEEA